MNGNRALLWSRPQAGSDMERIADCIRLEFGNPEILQNERFANYPAIRGICSSGARTVWTAVGPQNAGWNCIPRQEEIRLNQQRRRSWKSPTTDVSYDICWDRVLDSDCPSEIMQTKLRPQTSPSASASGLYYTRFYSFLGDFLLSAVDACSTPSVNRAYLYAVYPNSDLDDTLWSRIIPQGRTYTLRISPQLDIDYDNNDWINQRNGLINLNNRTMIRAAFGRGGNHHLVGLWERSGELSICADVIHQNCGHYSFALFSIRTISFESERWQLNDWLP